MSQPNSTQPIQLIAVDLDGTLLNSQHQLTERTEKALKAAVAKGVQVVLATGKTFNSGSWIVKQLNLKTPGIYSQGTVTYNSDGSIRTQQTLTPQIARQVITFGEDRGYLMAVYTSGRILVRSRNARMEELTTHYHEPMPEAVGSLQNVLDTVTINKVLAVAPGDARRTTALRWQLSMQINGSARLLQAGVDDMLEVLPKNASKGTALKTLIKDMGIPAAQVMAIGDAENDVEMIQLAGIGVAMGNASAHVKESAKVVVGSNDQDGVAEAIERFVLDTKPESEPTPEPQTTIG